MTRGHGLPKHSPIIWDIKDRRPTEVRDFNQNNPPHPDGRDEKSGHDRLKLYRWDELDVLPEPEPLIDDLLDRAAMSVVYGPSNCGKTFFALDLGARVSLGWPVFGLKSHQGPVIYIAAEPGRGFRRRRDAFDVRFLSHDTAPRPEFAFLPASVDLCNPNADTDLIIDRIEAMFPQGVALVVIDTLSRAMAGYNENSSEDMTAIVANCDRIREKTGAHVMIIHHTGKAIAAGSRGHSSLRAATDTEIEITKDEKTGISTAKVTKQRDRIGGEEFHFKLKQVEVGVDKDKKPVTSCVVVEPELDEVPTKRDKEAKPVRLTDDARIALEQLAKAIERADEQPPPGLPIPASTKAVRVSNWRAYCDKVLAPDSDKSDSKSRAFRRARSRLQAAKNIGVFGEWAWPL